MEVDRSILNKKNSTFKQNIAPESHTDPSATTVFHFRVGSFPMSSVPDARESAFERQNLAPLNSHHQTGDCNSNNRLMTMAEVVSHPSYYQHTTLYHPHQATGTCDRSQYPRLLTPSTSPQDYSSSGCILSAPDAPTPAATTPAPSNSVADQVEDDEDLTEVEPDQSTTRNEYSDSSALARLNVQSREEKKFIPVCQFEENCSMNSQGANPFCRKTVSHIFGRNKTCTQLIPDDLWIWYCRKHYQRCRYSVQNWALTQVEIVLETLNRFEKWEKIQSFTIALRKREKDRTRNQNNINHDDAPASRRRAIGRSSASRMHKVRESATGPSATAISNSRGKRGSKVTSAGRRKSFPVNIASPVPQFLYAYLGEHKSFDDIRLIIQQIGIYIEQEQELNNKEVSFPDIEILPVFTVEFLHSQGRTTDQLSENNHSRRRRARDVRLGYYNPSRALNERLQRDIYQHRSSFPIPHLRDALPRMSLHPIAHNTLPTPVEPRHEAQTYGHTHLPLLPPPVNMHFPYHEFRPL